MAFTKSPLYVAGGAAYPYSRALYEQTTMETRYGEPYPLGRLNAPDNTLWLPRAMCPPSVDDRRSVGARVKYDHRFTPRNPEQALISKQGRELLLDGENFIVQAPTGWGKTIVGCSMIAAPQRRTLVITTKDDIITQWVDAAKLVLGLSDDEIGIWRADQQPKPQHKIVIGLVQSIMRGPERYPDVDYASFGLVVCDETHRMGADQFSQAMWWFPGELRLGLSATPYRKDGRDAVFLGHIGPIALTAHQETLIPRVIIRQSDWRVPRVYRGGRMVKMPHEAGKLGHVSKMLARHASRNEMIGRFVGAAYRKERNTVIFSDTLAHLSVLHAAINGAGVPDEDIGYYVGTSTSDGSPYEGGLKARKVQREQAKAKAVVLATYQMASEATDVPWWDTCVLAIPRSDVVQIVGRIRREYPGKTQPVVLDIVDADSPVYEAFARKRLQWYKSIGCELRIKS